MVPDNFKTFCYIGMGLIRLPRPTAQDERELDGSLEI